ncbi:spindle assembly abnormal protein 6 homolog isoform X1 [Wyeomyia smithii]|uniref:spindle assembly abnormal protein 6 homolog isoform X1 n=1 Tax=Wyeomyia smithii TaxID=174621 RepID=UPI002467AF12|nr:spindle assembly abnormal protein 6 homolog isoform X1 [Wyeomyia smithii]
MDKYFIDLHRRRGVKVLFPCYQLPLNADNHGIHTMQKYSVVMEKMDLQNLIQIRLTECTDQSKMFISTIDNNSYEQIRTEQSLHVTFQGFIDHLTKILECCKKEELHISLVQNNNLYLLQFYEKSSFKNLMHLFLRIEPATTETVLFHINLSLQSFQDQTADYACRVQQYQLELASRDDTINRLQNDVRSLNTKLQDQENLIFNRNTEELNRLQQTIKHMNDAKEIEEKRLKAMLSAMQEKIDQQNREILVVNERLLQDTKLCESLREENNKLKSHTAQARNEIDRLKAELHSCQNRDGRNEAVIMDLRKQMIELQSKYKINEKQKSELEAELEAEKKICQTKKNALLLTTDELSNANIIISNLNKEIIRLKNKVELRTEIAMRQEKLIQDKEKDYIELQDTVKKIQQEHLKNRVLSEDYAQNVRTIKETSEAIEEKYRKKINDLILRVSQCQNMESNSIVNSHLGNQYLKLQNRIE